ncbi:hypothetical protein QR685DRAFT_549830 [Neurospora intermedia]|uniref:Extracellular membrane protein CFEM domain-containing protein n=1 Tax=Neurospora intermedia TaxID=5142 RepID=A0ABR3DRA8_NEUIN
MASKFITSLITLSLITHIKADIPVSIFSYTPYVRQRECVKDCIWHSGPTAENLIIALGCRGPWVNKCYCSGNDDYEHASTASSFLRSCVAKSCRTSSTNSLVTSAFDLYDEYCAEAGMAVPLVVASPTRTEDKVMGVVTGSGGDREPTAGGGSDSGMSNKGSGLSTGAKVGIAVGSAAAALALVASAVIAWRLKVNARVSPPRRRNVIEVRTNATGKLKFLDCK